MYNVHSTTPSEWRSDHSRGPNSFSATRGGTPPPTILDMVLRDRIKTELSEEDQAKAGKAIAMLDPKFRELQNDLQKLEILKREKRAPMELFKVATEGFGDTKSENEAKTALKLLYGWTEFSFSRQYGSAEWWQGYSSRIRDLKRRTEADILTTLQFGASSRPQQGTITGPGQRR